MKSQTYGLLPHVKITDLLLEVDRWTNFTRHFTHLKSADPVADRSLLLTAAWHIRDESYPKGLAELVNAQHKLPFAAHWGGRPHLPAMASDFALAATVNLPATATPKYGGSEPGTSAVGLSHGCVSRRRMFPNSSW